jgi:hypothetical protein
MREHELPTWNDIVDKAADSLHTARNAASEAADWMRSDWRPVGTALSDQAADARTEVFDIVRKIKDLVDQSAAVLERAYDGTGKGR